MSRGWNIFALLISLLSPLVTPAMASAAPHMSCCRTRAACCCHRTPAGPGFVAKCQSCAGARATAPLLRNALTPASARAAVMAATSPAIPLTRGFVRTIRTGVQFQRPPPVSA